MALTPITIAKLAEYFPQFASVAVSREATLNSMADLWVNADKFGDACEYGKVLMMAHLLALGDQGGAGPVTSETVGKLARSFGSVAATGWLELTSFGVEFKRLVRQRVCFPSIRFIGGC